MEVSGVVLRPFPCFSGAGFRSVSATQFKETSVFSPSVTAGKWFSGKALITSGDSLEIRVRISAKPFYSSVRSEFSDDGHRQYYASPRSGEKKEKEKTDKFSGADIVKKRLKLIKGLSKDLSAFYKMGFGVERGESLVEEVRGKMISEAAEVLLTQLQHLKAEEKEIKRKKKEEKAALKAARMKAMADDTSSSSSESSDSDCEEIVDMNRLRTKTLAEPTTEQPQASSEVELPLTIPSLPSINQQQTIELIENRSFSTAGQEWNPTTTSSNSINGSGSSGAVALSERIEVCMGGKCKKSGAVELLEEFERRVGVEGAVVGCKCMGKCRDGPNVRVSSCEKEEASVRSTGNPLCIGVGLEDVGVIVANFFGENKTDMGLLAA